MVATVTAVAAVAVAAVAAAAVVVVAVVAAVAVAVVVVVAAAAAAARARRWCSSRDATTASRKRFMTIVFPVPTLPCRYKPRGRRSGDSGGAATSTVVAVPVVLGCTGNSTALVLDDGVADAAAIAPRNRRWSTSAT